MLDFCSEHKIACDIEMIPIQKVNEAYERVLKSDVRYRFVIDMASLNLGAAAIGCPVERSSSGCSRKGMPRAEASEAMAPRCSIKWTITIRPEKLSPRGS